MTSVATEGGRGDTRPHANVSGAYFQLFTAGPSSPLRWRALSGNNREMCRSANTYPDVESCRLAIKELVSVLDALSPQLRRESERRWIWELARDGVVLVVAAHPFDRQIRCDQALRQFLHEAPSAHINETVVVTMNRRWAQRSTRPLPPITAVRRQEGRA